MSDAEIVNEIDGLIDKIQKIEIDINNMRKNLIHGNRVEWRKAIYRQSDGIVNTRNSIRNYRANINKKL